MAINMLILTSNDGISISILLSLRQLTFLFFHIAYCHYTEIYTGKVKQCT